MDHTVKISDLLFRKLAVITAVIIIGLLVTLSLIDRGIDYAVDVAALQDYYGIYVFIFVVGAGGLLVQLLCLKTAIETHKCYTLVSLVGYLIVAYLFLRHYEIIYDYIDAGTIFTGLKDGSVTAEAALAELQNLRTQAEALAASANVLIGYGIIQFIIGLIPDSSLNREKQKNTLLSFNQVPENKQMPLPKKQMEIEPKVYLINQKDHKRFEIKKSCTIGKNEACDYCINDMYLNPVHASIMKKGQGYVLKDCASVNKTYLNEQVLEPEKEYALRSGDYIVMADLAFEFYIE